jgi:hypothetical protein
VYRAASLVVNDPKMGQGRPNLEEPPAQLVYAG